MGNSCSNCKFGELEKDTGYDNCYNDIVLEMLSLNRIKKNNRHCMEIRKDFGCMYHEPKATLVYEPVSVVAVYQDGKFGGFYALDQDNKKYLITTTRNRDFVPVFKQEG